MGFWSILGTRSRGSLERAGPVTRQTRPGVARAGASTWIVALLAMVVVWAATSYAILYRIPRSSFDFIAGQRAAASVVALADFEYVDLAATEARRLAASMRVPDIWSYDAAALELTRANLLALLAALQEPVLPVAGGEPRPGATGAVDALLARATPELVDFLRALLDGEDQRQFLLTQCEQALRQGVIATDDRFHYPADATILVLDERNRTQTVPFGSRPTSLAAATEALRQFARRFPVANAAGNEGPAAQLLARLFFPSLRLNAERTAAERRAAAAKVPRVMVAVPQGTVFLRRGAVVDGQAMEILHQHSAAVTARSRFSGDQVLASARLMVMALLLIVTGYVCLRLADPARAARRGQLLLLGLMVTLQVLLLWATSELYLAFWGPSRLLLYAALPLGWSGIVTGLLLGPRVGTATGLFAVALGTLFLEDPLHVLLLGGISSLIGALAVRSARTRVQTFRTMAYLPLVVWLAESLFLALSLAPWPYYLWVLGIAVGNCFGSTLLANVLLPVCEWGFRLTTNISLLELGDLNHPLLRRLQTEAPGTYHHTLNVATLAEHAAEAIGANLLLARVASYFHDVGKLSNPAYFTENAFGGDPHEDLSPRLSALVILNHIKEGEALARRYKLPSPIIEAITTHQGTGLVYFFYRRAVEQQLVPDGASAEGEFRYPGPLPHSREASIICLADACEAASRTLDRPTPTRLNALVDDLVALRLRDGQFDESELTMAEIHRVALSIKTTLSTMYHGRVAYPARAAAEHGTRRTARATQRQTVTQKLPPEALAPAATRIMPAPDPHAPAPAQPPASVPPAAAPASAAPAAANHALPRPLPPAAADG